LALSRGGNLSALRERLRLTGGSRLTFVRQSESWTKKSKLKKGRTCRGEKVKNQSRMNGGKGSRPLLKIQSLLFQNGEKRGGRSRKRLDEDTEKE